MDLEADGQPPYVYAYAYLDREHFFVGLICCLEKILGYPVTCFGYDSATIQWPGKGDKHELKGRVEKTKDQGGQELFDESQLRFVFTASLSGEL